MALSVLIAMCASYAALDLAGRTAATQGQARAAWLLGGATAMGAGIWSMHYIGMLAFHLPIPILYDLPTVFISLLAAIFSSALALFVVSRKEWSTLRAAFASLVMGGGIATMHYTGMAAMRMRALAHYDHGIVALSVLIAVTASFAALLLAFYFRQESHARWMKLASAMVMGIAIAAMHYTGMAAATFTASNMPMNASDAVGISSLGALGIAGITQMVLGLAILTSVVDRRFSAQAMRLETTEERYRQLLSPNS